ncbi:DNA-directed RNA polymerase subunit H [Candidatus Woesearchaeota archaeon]|nr:DNA-directed RNA polymerase subunit H [Candidatus Woesearchaeota archaeon]
MKKELSHIPQNHILVPKHEKLTDKDKKSILDKYNITFEQLPRILKTDAAITHLDVKASDVIKITRTNKTAYETIFYRRVIE